MQQSSELNQYPIRTVSEMTGVNPVTLRAWERRYGLIKPLRTAKGHRIYTDEHVELINRVCGMLGNGRSISHIAAELRTREETGASRSQAIWERYRDHMIRSIESFDERGLDAIYNEANSIYPVDIVTRMLIIPMLRLVGDRWSDRTGTVAEEHFFSVYLRNKIGARFHHQNIQNKGPRLVAACLPGELHEFGMLLFTLSAHSRGYRIIMLGADLPMEELPQVVDRSGADGIVLSGSSHAHCSGLQQSLVALLDNTDVPVCVGGDIIDTCPDELRDPRLHLLGTDIMGATAEFDTIFT